MIPAVVDKIVFCKCKLEFARNTGGGCAKAGYSLVVYCKVTADYSAIHGNVGIRAYEVCTSAHDKVVDDGISRNYEVERSVKSACDSTTVLSEENNVLKST